MLMDIMFEVPDIKGKKKVTITKDIVNSNKKSISDIIKLYPNQIESA